MRACPVMRPGIRPGMTGHARTADTRHRRGASGHGRVSNPAPRSSDHGRTSHGIVAHGIVARHRRTASSHGIVARHRRTASSHGIYEHARRRHLKAARHPGRSIDTTHPTYRYRHGYHNKTPELANVTANYNNCVTSTNADTAIK